MPTAHLDSTRLCWHVLSILEFHTPRVTEKFVSAAASLIESNATPSVRCPVDNLVSDIEVVLGV